jgi:hypothetical protein
MGTYMRLPLALGILLVITVTFETSRVAKSTESGDPLAKMSQKITDLSKSHDGYVTKADFESALHLKLGAPQHIGDGNSAFSAKSDGGVLREVTLVYLGSQKTSSLVIDFDSDTDKICIPRVEIEKQLISANWQLSFGSTHPIVVEEYSRRDGKFVIHYAGPCVLSVKINGQSRSD